MVSDVGRRAMKTPADVRKIVDEFQSKHTILIHIKRSDTISFVAIPIG
jgi:hypothetical protein